MSTKSYGDAVLGGREAIPEMLKLFSRYGVRATWATVGLLFARTRKEMLGYIPDVLPQYSNTSLSNYKAIRDEIGENEKEDPYHFGRSLLDLVAETPGQEIATHTFAHYYCLEDGQTLDAFRADIQSAQAIAKSAGHHLRSIVFPRNQYSTSHVGICVEEGITAFRGQPDAFAYRSMANRKVTPIVRGLRLLDSIIPVVSRKDLVKPEYCVGARDVRASRFLRPYRSSWPAYSRLHLNRVRSEMRVAAKQGQQYHLWWHPHNFGRNTRESLVQLESILAEYARLNTSLGMESVTMLQAAHERPSAGGEFC
ncbi:polysaccharide deacetylase family protein [Marimonas sp. MJW-29]|uniref:Polysaccharide deacetylase family protein n=1 Tax=Sulfitobacter sediminis TaxID=3234186 RepID=A0ABV3RMY9_9RHOB